MSRATCPVCRHTLVGAPTAGTVAYLEQQLAVAQEQITSIAKKRTPDPRVAELENELACEHDAMVELADGIGAISKEYIGREFYNESPIELVWGLRDAIDAERERSKVLREALESLCKDAPAEENPEWFEHNDNHGDTFDSGISCGAWTVVNRVRAALAAVRGEGE